MSKQDDVRLIRQLLEEEAQVSSLILGARIGDLVKKKLPDMSIKNEFGSIGKLISTNFADLMIIKGKKGNDIQYAFTSQPPTNITGNPESVTASKNTSENKIIEISAKGLNVAQKRALLNTEELQSNADFVLRQAIKNAVDIMTSEQLRQLVLPAGILFDAISKATHTQ